MNWLRALPAQIRWTLGLGLHGLALTVPFSAPDGTGMQWDELVLGGVAASSAWAFFRTARGMDRTAGLPWRTTAGFAYATTSDVVPGRPNGRRGWIREHRTVPTSTPSLMPWG